VRNQRTVSGKLFCLIAICFLTSLTHAQPPQAIVETSFGTSESMVFKQRSELVVRFLTDGFAFAKPPVFPDIKIDGAIVIPPTSGMNLTERRQGDTWVGMERRYDVYPVRTGQLTVPALTLTAQVRNSKGVHDVNATSATIQAAVTIPDAVRNSPNVIISTNFRATQEWEPEDVNLLKVGDALQRTLVLSAENTTAMLLPPPPVADINGVSIYPSQPTLNDRNDRGRISATRTDLLTYVCESIGAIAIPPITLTWWHPQTNETHQETLPGLNLTLVENPELTAAQAAVAPEENQDPPSTRMGWGWLALPLFVFICWILYRRYGRILREHWQQWKQAQANSERTAFRHLQRACTQDNPQQAIRALRQWLDKSMGSEWTLQAFSKSIENPSLQLAVDNLNEHLFGTTTTKQPWSGNILREAVTQARTQWKQKTQSQQLDTQLCPMYPEKM